MAFRPLDARLLASMVADFWPDTGYVDYNEKHKLYLIGDGPTLFAVLRNSGTYPVLMLRASLLPVPASTLGYICTACCDFKFGKIFEVTADGKWAYDEIAQGVAADNIHHFWFGIDRPVDDKGNPGFVMKTDKQLEGMN